MNSDIRTFFEAWYGDENKGNPEGTRRIIRKSSPEYQARLERDSADVISKRELTPDKV